MAKKPTKKKKPAKKGARKGARKASRKPKKKALKVGTKSCTVRTICGRRRRLCFKVTVKNGVKRNRIVSNTPA